MDEGEGACRKEVSLARHKADEARSSLQQSQSRGKVLDSLLRMRDSGRIKGIYVSLIPPNPTPILLLYIYID